MNVEIPKFYAPVINLLTADKTWSGMRTVGELRRERGETIPVNQVLHYYQPSAIIMGAKFDFRAGIDY